MINIDLNYYNERKTCGDIARELAITGSDPATLIKFMRGSNKGCDKGLNSAKEQGDNKAS